MKLAGKSVMNRAEGVNLSGIPFVNRTVSR